MNIITNIYGSDDYFIRPGTSLNQGGNDYFCPEEITVAAVPFIWVKADKPGKSVKERFAKKYYTTSGYGIRIIAKSLLGPNPTKWFIANSLNHTTYLSQAQLSQKEFEQINKVIENTSKLTSFKTGDLISLDLISLENAIEPIENKIQYKEFNINIL